MTEKVLERYPRKCQQQLTIEKGAEAADRRLALGHI